MNGWEVFDALCTISAVVFAFLCGYEYRRGKELEEKLDKTTDELRGIAIYNRLRKSLDGVMESEERKEE